MKLEKREITLNEADSIKDMYFYEKSLQMSYEQALENAERKEVQGEVARLLEEVKKEVVLLEELRKCTPMPIGKKSGQTP